MDKRRKNIHPEVERALREKFYRDIENNQLSVPAAVKAMRRLSKLTQAEFSQHRGISLATLKLIESGKSQAKVETLNKIGDIFGLSLNFTRKINEK